MHISNVASARRYDFDGRRFLDQLDNSPASERKTEGFHGVRDEEVYRYCIGLELVARGGDE